MINSSNMKVKILLAFCFCLFFREALYSSTETIHHPLKPTFLSNGSYSEVYELSAVLEDETFIQALMVVTNVGLRDSNAVCQILVLQPGEAPWKASKRFGKTGWNYSDTPNEALSIGHCRLAQVKDSTTCTMAFGNATVSLSFDVTPNPVTLPASLNVSDEQLPLRGKASSKFYRYELLIPWSGLQATINLPGSPKKVVSGSGILVHSRSVGYPKDFSRGWVYFYGCSSGCRFLANFRFQPHDTGGVVGWIWKGNEQTPQPVTGMQVIYESPVVNGKKMTHVAVSPTDSSFAITSRLELYRFSIIDDLGPILGAIIKLVLGNPVTRFYNAQVTLSPENPPLQGILEVMRFE